MRELQYGSFESFELSQAEIAQAIADYFRENCECVPQHFTVTVSGKNVSAEITPVRW